MIFSLTNGLVADKQGAAISKSPTLSQTAVGKLPLYHGRARCQRKRIFVMSSGVSRSLGITARERSEDPEANSNPDISGHSGRNDRKFPSGRRVHQPCS